MNLYKYNKDKIKFEKQTIFNVYGFGILFNIISLFCFCGVVLFSNHLINENKIIKQENQKNIKEINKLNSIIKIINKRDDFNKTNLHLMLEGMNIKFIDIVIAQTKLETNNYSSKIFKENGNLFGMKTAKLRPYTHYGEKRGHADYKGNWRLSVIDFALWQARECTYVKTKEQYLFLLENIYAEDSNYVAKLKKMIK